MLCESVTPPIGVVSAFAAILNLAEEMKHSKV
jgi:hypothetical protein